MKRKNVIRRRINKRFIPNIFTILNMYFGFSAIVMLINGDPIRAAWFVFAAAILDAFDGKLARALGIESTFGTEFDSFADTISFCVTSSILIYTTWTNGLLPVFAIIISFMPILFGTVRLAKFNLLKDETNERFNGLTTPLYANLIFGYVIFNNHIYNNYGNPEIGIVLTLFFGLLTISRIELGNIPYLSFKRGRKNSIRLITAIVILSSIIFTKGLTIFPIFFIYVLWSLINWFNRLDKIVLIEKLKPTKE